MKNLVIGITGGIGSGKSTVSEIYTNEGYKILNADDVAKSVMINNAEVKKSIIENFGADCYHDNELNTKIIAEKVFDHPNKIQRLNEIVHPPTIKVIEEEIKNLRSKLSLVFVEAALIFEANMENLFDYILLVTADENLRIKRVLERDIETVSEIRSRMLHQIPEEKKRKRSDFVIDNNSSFSELKSKSLFFLNLFKSLIASQ